MKHEKTWTTIGAPHKLYNSTLVNFVSNGQRNNWVKAGREADEEHQNRPGKRYRTTKVPRNNAKALKTIFPEDTGVETTSHKGNIGNENDNTTQAPPSKNLP